MSNIGELSAESIYMRQHATIVAAIDLLQKTLDDMLVPADMDLPITWRDVSVFDHVASAASTLLESIGA